MSQQGRTTTMEDIPMEVLECILIKAVVSEVHGLRLARTVWPDKVDAVIRRLSSVSTTWNAVMTTDAFRTEVMRILDNVAEMTIHLEVASRHLVPFVTYRVTSWRNQLACLYSPSQPSRIKHAVNVYDLDHMGTVKDTVPLTRMDPVDLASCNISNCMYVLSDDANCFNVYRISKDVNDRYAVVPLITNLRCRISQLCVNAKGSIILPMVKKGQEPACIKSYDSAGSFEHRVVIPDKLYFSVCDTVMEKANGNMIIASYGTEALTQLTELDSNGKIVREHRSFLGWQTSVNFTDNYDRLVIWKSGLGIEWLDTEMNDLDFEQPRYLIPKVDFLRFSRDMNQLIAVNCTDYNGSLIMLLQFT